LAIIYNQCCGLLKALGSLIKYNAFAYCKGKYFRYNQSKISTLFLPKEEK